VERSGRYRCHYLAPLENPRDAIASIRLFRSMTQQNQKDAAQQWIEKPPCDQRAQRKVLASSITTQERLLKNEVDWDAVAPKGAEALAALPRPTGQRRASQTNNTANKRKKAVADNSKVVEAYSHCLAVEKSKKKARASISTQDPAVSPEESDEEKENSKKYIGLGSGKEDREKEAKEMEEKAKSGHQRTIGTYGTELQHQADSKSCGAVERAYKATAKASDTVHVVNRPVGALRRAIVTIEVSELEEIRQDGGQVSEEDLKRSKVLVRISGARSRDEVKWIFEHVCKAMKHNEQSRLTGHERVELHSSDDPDLSATFHVNAFFDARTQARAQPSQTPRSTTTLVNETFETFTNHQQSRAASDQSENYQAI